MSFGARLAEKRKAKGLTQEGLGKGLGTDGKDAGKAVVYGWEKNQHFPRVDQLALICERLDESADYLMFGKRDSLLPEAREIASSISAMPPREREWVLQNVREVIRIGNQMFNQQPPVDAQDGDGSHKRVRNG